MNTHRSHATHSNQNRHMVALATTTCPRKRKRAFIDSGAGLTVCDDDSLYLPSSKHSFPGEVMWGDGARKKIKYAGVSPAMGKMINTSGAADSALISVGSQLDHLTKEYGRDFVMAFDRSATYLMKDAKFVRGKRGINLQYQNNGSTIMQTATRGTGESAVYEAPLYDDMDVQTDSSQLPPKHPAVRCYPR